MWPLHRLNRLRVPFIVERIERYLMLPVSAQPLDGLSVLDVGCAGGLLSEAMARRGATVTGIDPSANNIAVARSHADAAGLAIDYRNAAVEELAGEQFDVVLNMEVVEHVNDLAGFMAGCCRLTRPGGMQFVATINRTFASFASAVVGAEYVLGWLPRGTHQWRRFVKPEELEAVLREEGLRVVGRRGVAVNPLTRQFRTTTYEGVNYMLATLRRG